MVRDKLRQEKHGFFPVYDFILQLPPTEAIMLSYLIDAEGICTEKLPGDPSYFMCAKEGFIDKYLSGWSDYTISNTISKLANKGLISTTVKNVHMRNRTYIRINEDAIANLQKTYSSNHEKTYGCNTEECAVCKPEETIVCNTEKPSSNPQVIHPQVHPQVIHPDIDANASIISENSLSSKEGGECLVKEEVLKDVEAAGSPAPAKKPREVKHKYGEYQHVMLSDSDYSKLQEEFPTDLDKRIRSLDEYIETTGKKYKNHKLVIETWARRDKEKQQPSGYRKPATMSEYQPMVKCERLKVK